MRVQLAQLRDQRIDVEARDLHARRARVFAERVHHLLHRFDLLDDGVRGAIEQLAFAPFGLQILAAQPLGGELNRRQRILDLVREPPRHFAPGRVALRLQQRRDVVEHDRVAVRAVAVAGQLRAGAHQHAPAAFARAA